MSRIRPLHDVAALLALSLALALIPTPASIAQEDQEDPRPWAEQPFLGLSVRDTPEGTVVAWIAPGPLGGRGFESRCGVRRGDNLVSVDGRALDAEAVTAYVKDRKPGDEVVLVFRRSPDASAEAAVPKGGAGGEPFEVRATLATREEWAGQVGRGLGTREVESAAAGELEATLLAAAGEVGARAGRDGVGGGLDALLPYLARIQEEALDPGSLPAVVQAFRRPLSLDAIEAGVAAVATVAARGGPGDVEAFVRHVLDLPDPDVTIREVMGKPASEMMPAEARSMVRFAGQHLEEMQGPKGWREPLERLLRTLREGVYIYDDHADEHVRTINRIGGPHAASTLALALAMLRLAPPAWEALAAPHANDPALTEVPEAVRASVEGDVLFVAEDALGHVAVVGGPGPNRYDLSKISAVYDVGGNDRYDYPAATSPVALRIVIDLMGDDVHEAGAAFEGPATAVCGLSVLDDRGGNDVYRTAHVFGVGAGLMGLGILVDRAGDDVYESRGASSGWGLGAGFWGAGLLIDHAGHDVYDGEIYVEGVGGPRGLGAVLDASGRDLYRANGRSNGSAYGTPAVYVGMSQGFGFGVRGYAAGGLGAIYDLEGNDRYEAGEFSQAGGYYFGMGILHDLAGHDLYYGNRYGQAFSAHQAVGVLVDDAGDDTYWSMTAASQAGTWDQSIGLLLDRQGDDAYRCDGLGQGGASMQAIAILADLQGDDRYSGSGASVQGQGGGNAYHYDADKVFSFSALVDLGGGRDAYSSGRKNDLLVATGEWKEARPADASLYGLFLDR